MRNLAIGVIALGSAAVSSHAAAGSGSDAALPGSMLEFVNWNLDRGACGTWVESGVTEAMWVGIPAGLEYTNTQNTWYDVPTGQIYNSHHMETEDGRVISTGSNIMTWDADRKQIVAAGSGFDMGKPFNGTSVLVGMTDDALSWEYTETSQGKTTVYENVVTYQASPSSGMNSRVNAVNVKGGDGKPWISESNRANPGREALAEAALPGTWETTGPDGTISRQVVSWVADEHVLKFERSAKAPGGEWMSESLFVWYWDPAYDHIATLYLDGHGTVIHGKVESITRNGDAVTIVASHEGSRFGGLTMSTQATQVITDKTITTTFQDMSLDGMRHKMSWSEGAQTIDRVK